MDKFVDGPHVHDYLAEMTREVFDGRDGEFITIGEMPGVTTEQARLYTDPARGELNMVFQFEHVSVDQGPAGKFDYLGLDLVVLKKIAPSVAGGVGGNRLEQPVLEQPRPASRRVPVRRRRPGLLGRLGEGARDRSARHARHPVRLSRRGTRNDELPVPDSAGPQGPRGRELLQERARTRAATRVRRWPVWPRSAATTPAHQCNGTRDRTPDSPPADPWLPVNPNYTWLNAAAQIDATDSVFAHYQALIRLRHELPILVDGDFTPLMAEDPQIWAYTRTTPNGKLLVIANCGRDPRTVEIGREWIAADLLLGNLPDTPATSTSTSLDLAGWDARIYSAAH